MKIRQILLDYIDKYLLKYKFSKIGVSKSTISYINIIDNIRSVKISKFNTDEYWMESYVSEENLSGIVIKKSSILTAEELYGFYKKVRLLNNGKYKYKPFIDINEKIKKLGYILDSENTYNLVYIKGNIDNDLSRIIIFKDRTYGKLYLKAEYADNRPFEMNEEELFVFYKKMKSISKQWEDDSKTIQRFIMEEKFE